MDSSTLVACKSRLSKKSLLQAHHFVPLVFESIIFTFCKFSRFKWPLWPRISPGLFKNTFLDCYNILLGHQPMPSPGRDAEFISQRKRVAPANIVQKDQKMIRVMKVCNEKKINKCEISEEELGPMIGLRLAVREAEKKIRQHAGGPNKDMLHRLLQMRTERLVDKG